MELLGYGTSAERLPVSCHLIKITMVSLIRNHRCGVPGIDPRGVSFLVDREPLAETNSAHGNKGVNGLTLSSDGRYLVSLGMDENIRLWDTDSGHNTLVNYGNYWRNRFKSHLQAVVSDADVWPPLLFVPSDDQQVLVFSLLDGRLTKRLKGAYGRVTSVERRSSYQEFYSGSREGEILVWEPTKTSTTGAPITVNNSYVGSLSLEDDMAMESTAEMNVSDCFYLDHQPRKTNALT